MCFSSATADDVKFVSCSVLARTFPRLETSTYILSTGKPLVETRTESSSLNIFLDQESYNVCVCIFSPPQAMMMAVTVWIARWSQKSGEEQKRKVYVGTLIILTLGTVVVSVFRAALSFFALVRVSSGQ